MKTKARVPKSPVVKIISKRIEGDILPARAVAYRRNGSRLEAGDKFLRPAVVALFALITGERLLPKDISKLVKERRMKVSKPVMEVL